ncbi:MAG: FAD-dependent oxidoreductase [Pseudomonadota bacterium]
MAQLLTPDICVIGAGSGGLSVAAAAAAFGVETILIEKDKMGGDCLNFGCVPSKALLAVGKNAEVFRSSAEFGIKPAEPNIDFEKVHAHIHDVISTIEPHDSQERFEGLGVKVIRDFGRFVNEDTVVTEKYEIRARRFVIATGSAPFVPPIHGIDDIPFFTNETIFQNKKKIDHLIVIGGGPIGMEMAQAHRRLGSKVTVVEGLKALGKDDPELTQIVLEKLRGEEIEILENAKVEKLAKKGRSGIVATVLRDGVETEIEGSHLLVATGRAVNVAGMGLEDANIEYSTKGIRVWDDLRTTNQRVYAIGDVAGGLQFTHVAGYHAGLVIRGILFRQKASPQIHMIPWVTFTDPEIAHIGQTEEEARGKDGGTETQVLKWDYKENDRALAERKTTGFIKIIASKRGRILGVSIVGANAGEMINMWSLAIANKMKLRDVIGYISPYPTMSEIGKRAVVSSYSPLAKKPLVRWVVRFLQKFG